TPDPGYRKAPGQVCGKQRAQQCRREVVGRRRQVKAHISEGGDEVEQDAEANRVDRKEPWIAEMRDHLFGGRGEAARAHETALAWQRKGNDDRANKRHQPTAPNDARQPSRSATAPAAKRPKNPPTLEPETNSPVMRPMSAGGHSSPT